MSVLEAPDELQDDLNFAGRACGWQAMEADDPVSAIIRGSIRETAGDTERARVLIDADGRDGLVNTDRSRVEVF